MCRILLQLMIKLQKRFEQANAEADSAREEATQAQADPAAATMSPSPQERRTSSFGANAITSLADRAATVTGHEEEPLGMSSMSADTVAPGPAGAEEHLQVQVSSLAEELLQAKAALKVSTACGYAAAPRRCQPHVWMTSIVPAGAPYRVGGHYSAAGSDGSGRARV